MGKARAAPPPRARARKAPAFPRAESAPSNRAGAPADFIILRHPRRARAFPSFAATPFHSRSAPVRSSLASSSSRVLRPYIVPRSQRRPFPPHLPPPFPGTLYTPRSLSSFPLFLWARDSFPRDLFPRCAPRVLITDFEDVRAIRE